MKKCSYCSEEIQDAAIKCRFCGEFLNDDKNKVHLQGKESMVTTVFNFLRNEFCMADKLNTKSYIIRTIFRPLLCLIYFQLISYLNNAYHFDGFEITLINFAEKGIIILMFLSFYGILSAYIRRENYKKHDYISKYRGHTGGSYFQMTDQEILLNTNVSPGYFSFFTCCVFIFSLSYIWQGYNSYFHIEPINNVLYENYSSKRSDSEIKNINDPKKEKVLTTFIMDKFNSSICNRECQLNSYKILCEDAALNDFKNGYQPWSAELNERKLSKASDDRSIIIDGIFFFTYKKLYKDYEMSDEIHYVAKIPFSCTLTYDFASEYLDNTTQHFQDLKVLRMIYGQAMTHYKSK